MTEVLDIFADCPVEPVGYRMVLGQLPKKEISKGGIVIPDNVDTSRAQELLSSISQIVKLGPLCFKADHFRTFEERAAAKDGHIIKSGYTFLPRVWANVGDWVLHGPNAGFRLPVEKDGKKVIYRILNDDEFLAVIPDLQTLDAVMPVLTPYLTT